MSLRASPAWSASTPASRTTAAPISDSGAGAVGPPDAPGGEQGAAEPAEVEQRREAVAVEGEDPDAVQQLGVLRVEPGEELRRDEVEVEGRVALGEDGGERAVVPGGVEAGDPGVEDEPHAHRPVGDDERRRPAAPPISRRARSSGAGGHSPEAPAACGRDQGADRRSRGRPSRSRTRARRRAPTLPSSSATRSTSAVAEDQVGEPGRRPGPARQQARAHAALRRRRRRRRPRQAPPLRSGSRRRPASR